ncbi:MAG: hypothetical protein AAF787_20300 [Chloroflexota bacterium]
MTEIPDGHKFSAGQTRATQAAMKAMQDNGHIASEFLARHVVGDWGEHDPEQKAQNDESLANDGPLHSIYHMADGRQIWVFTEADRSMTTILLPEDAQ